MLCSVKEMLAAAGSSLKCLGICTPKRKTDSQDSLVPTILSHCPLLSHLEVSDIWLGCAEPVCHFACAMLTGPQREPCYQHWLQVCDLLRWAGVAASIAVHDSCVLAVQGLKMPQLTRCTQLFLCCRLSEVFVVLRLLRIIYTFRICTDADQSQQQQHCMSCWH